MLKQISNMFAGLQYDFLYLSLMIDNRQFNHNEIPYFAWDRHLTVKAIRERLEALSGVEWSRLAAWIMREAAFRDVWQFLSPHQAYARLNEIQPFLGRKRSFWQYILGTWHEMGKV